MVFVHDLLVSNCLVTRILGPVRYSSQIIYRMDHSEWVLNFRATIAVAFAHLQHSVRREYIHLMTATDSWPLSLSNRLHRATLFSISNIILPTATYTLLASRDSVNTENGLVPRLQVRIYSWAALPRRCKRTIQLSAPASLPYYVRSSSEHHWCLRVPVVVSWSYTHVRLNSTHQCTFLCSVTGTQFVIASAGDTVVYIDYFEFSLMRLHQRCVFMTGWWHLTSKWAICGFQDGLDQLGSSWLADMWHLSMWSWRWCRRRTRMWVSFTSQMNSVSNHVTVDVSTPCDSISWSEASIDIAVYVKFDWGRSASCFNSSHLRVSISFTSRFPGLC